MPLESLVFFLDSLNSIISLVGIAIISISAARATMLYIKYYNRQDISNVRIELGHGIILGLEFMVAADIITTVAHPTYFELGLLALLVLIRTVLSYFITQELASVYKHTQQTD